MRDGTIHPLITVEVETQIYAECNLDFKGEIDTYYSRGSSDSLLLTLRQLLEIREQM